MYKGLITNVRGVANYTVKGLVSAVRGLTIECVGISRFVVVGSRCGVIKIDKTEIIAEVISVTSQCVYLLSYSDNQGVAVGSCVRLIDEQIKVYPDILWLGRVINGLAEPIDDKGSLPHGQVGHGLHNTPPLAHKRRIIEKRMDVGVRAINTFITCSYGQRMGIFAGSGVGKSVLLAMITRFASSDVKVIGLIGERGREVQEFLQTYLGEEGLSKAVVVVATGNESPLMRKRAAYLVFTIAEYFRDQGMNVLCLIDSITRFAIAQKEIGLSSGEVPITKGYTTSVFTELPKLLERAGMGEGEGSITGLFTVLVEGDDTDEPVADSVRAILDGHIIMDRSIAERGRFPAINILHSISRTMSSTDKELLLIQKARKIIATYTTMEELIKLGIYKQGSDQDIDEAIKYYPMLDKFLSQKPTEYTTLDESYRELARILERVFD